MDWTVQSETRGEWVNIHPELHSSHLNTRSQVMDNFFTSAGKYELALNQVAEAVQPSSALNASWINSSENLESCCTPAAAWALGSRAVSTELPGSEQEQGCPQSCSQPGLLHTSKGHSSQPAPQADILVALKEGQWQMKSTSLGW